MKTILRRVAAGLVALTAALAFTGGAQAESTWEKIQATGKLRMGVTQAPPWYSKNPATGEWDSGLIVSVGKSMAEELGVELEMHEVTWATSIAALQADKIDMMFLDPTPKRAVVVDYPFQPLLYISLAVLARDDLPVESWQDLDKPEVSVAVPQASSMDAFLTRNDSQRRHPALPGQRRVARRVPVRTGRCGLPLPPPAAGGAEEVRRRKDRDSDPRLQLAVVDCRSPGGRQDLPGLGQPHDLLLLRDRADPALVRGVPDRVWSGPEGIAGHPARAALRPMRPRRRRRVRARRRLRTMRNDT